MPRFILPLLALACATPDEIYIENCQVDVVVADIVANPGDDAEINGGPFTRVADTRVVVGGAEATVTAVGGNDECSVCITCKASNDECDECGACSVCATTCEPCVEFVRFVVPSLPPGDHVVLLFNEHGSSNAAFLTVPASDDTGADDTASGDSGDTGDSDTGDSDTDEAIDTAPDTSPADTDP